MGRPDRLLALVLGIGVGLSLFLACSLVLGRPSSFFS